jgi:ABC-type Zn uptake system ZnuABC Zn-binding protein ZnuA
MTIKELLIHELDELKETDLEKVVEYIKFLKIKHIFMPLKNSEEKDYASLYAEFEEED